MIDPDGVAEIIGFTAEDWFARHQLPVLDADGVQEILGSDGLPRVARIYRSELSQLFSIFMTTSERINFDATTDNRRYKVSFISDGEGKKTISKFVIDE
jgi:hypothetical protein